MRVLRCLAAGLISVAGGLAIAVDATPATAAPPFGATLTLDPSSGRAGTTITATFQVNDPVATNCRLRVTYRWENQIIGEDRTNSCLSQVRFRARGGRDLGPHEVSAVDGTTRQAVAIFTITAVDATPDPTATPTRTRTAGPSATANQSADAVVPLPVDTGPPVTSANPQVLPQIKPASSALSSMALIFGGALVLGGVAILILVVLRVRRGDPGPDGYADTEPEPVPVGGPPGGYLSPPGDYPGALGDYPTERISPDSSGPAQPIWGR
jgi:hypothetical protein